MNLIYKYGPLVSRIFISAIFLFSGVNKIRNFQGTKQYMSTAGIPVTAFFLVIAIILEIAGGLSILVGFKAKIGAFLLIIFIIPTTLIFHTNFPDQVQMIMFMKNLAILGGLISVAVYGSGSISLDKANQER